MVHGSPIAFCRSIFAFRRCCWARATPRSYGRRRHWLEVRWWALPLSGCRWLAYGWGAGGYLVGTGHVYRAAAIFVRMAGVRSVGDGRGVAGRHCRDGGDWFIDRGGNAEYGATLRDGGAATSLASVIERHLRDYAYLCHWSAPILALLLLFDLSPVGRLAAGCRSSTGTSQSARFVGLSNYIVCRPVDQIIIQRRFHQCRWSARWCWGWRWQKVLLDRPLRELKPWCAPLFPRRSSQCRASA